MRSHSCRNRRTSCSGRVAPRSSASSLNAPPACTGDSCAQSPTSSTLAPAVVSVRPDLVEVSGGHHGRLVDDHQLPGRERPTAVLGQCRAAWCGRSRVPRDGQAPASRAAYGSIRCAVRAGSPVLGDPFGGVLGGHPDGVGEDVRGGGRGREADHRCRARTRLPRRRVPRPSWWTYRSRPAPTSTSSTPSRRHDRGDRGGLLLGRQRMSSPGSDRASTLSGQRRGDGGLRWWSVRPQGAGPRRRGAPGWSTARCRGRGTCWSRPGAAATRDDADAPAGSA